MCFRLHIASGENFWCPGTIERLSDESTVLGREKLGCGWVFVNYRGGEADWQLFRPTFFNAKKPGGWQIFASAAELETNFEFEDLSKGDERGDESGDESDDGDGDDENSSDDDPSDVGACHRVVRIHTCCSSVTRRSMRATQARKPLLE